MYSIDSFGPTAEEGLHAGFTVHHRHTVGEWELSLTVRRACFLFLVGGGLVLDKLLLLYRLAN